MRQDVVCGKCWFPIRDSFCGLACDGRADGVTVNITTIEQCRKCSRSPARFAVRQPWRPYHVVYFVCGDCATVGLSEGVYDRVGRWGGVQPVVFLPPRSDAPAADYGYGMTPDAPARDDHKFFDPYG